MDPTKNHPNIKGLKKIKIVKMFVLFIKFTTSVILIHLVLNKL